MRHSIRVLKTMQRAEAGARAAQHRLLLATCADRCYFENRPIHLTPALGQEAASVHALSATGNLPAIIALYPGVELCLETKLCPELGLVRGCTVILEDIILADNEPHLRCIMPSLQFYLRTLHPPSCLHTDSCLISFFTHSLLPNNYATPTLRPFDKNPDLSPHPLLHLPVGLLLRAPGATWIKHAALGPGRFFLGPATHSWRFYPRDAPAEHVLFDCDNKAYMQLHRCQLPVTNTCHDTLHFARPNAASNYPGSRAPTCHEARALPALVHCYPANYLSFLLAFLVDSGRIPSQDDYWIACLVLLSRVRSMDDLLLFRLPDFTALNRPRPEYLRAAYKTFHDHEASTLRNLEHILAQLQLQHLRDLVTTPLLTSHAPPVPCRKLPRHRRS